MYFIYSLGNDVSHMISSSISYHPSSRNSSLRMRRKRNHSPLPYPSPPPQRHSFHPQTSSTAQPCEVVPKSRDITGYSESPFCQDPGCACYSGDCDMKHSVQRIESICSSREQRAGLWCRCGCGRALPCSVRRRIFLIVGEGRLGGRP